MTHSALVCVVRDTSKDLLPRRDLRVIVSPVSRFHFLQRVEESGLVVRLTEAVLCKHDSNKPNRLHPNPRSLRASLRIAASISALSERRVWVSCSGGVSVAPLIIDRAFSILWRLSSTCEERPRTGRRRRGHSPQDAPRIFAEGVAGKERRRLSIKPVRFGKPTGVGPNPRFYGGSAEFGKVRAKMPSTSSTVIKPKCWGAGCGRCFGFLRRLGLGHLILQHEWSRVVRSLGRALNRIVREMGRRAGHNGRRVRVSNFGCTRILN